jgi:CHRD domain-containing protein/PEP-CTERM motif-containing protein
MQEKEFFMRLVLTALVAALLVTLASSTASADTILFANLTNAAENPPTVPTTSTGGARPASFGTALFTLNDDMTALRFAAIVFNIDFTGNQTADPFDNLTAAHIHAGATVTPTTNGGVVWGFFGSPFNDNNPNDVMISPFANGVGGTISGKWDAPEGNNTTLAAQLPFILSNRSYINFHTTQFGGGEIRGNISAETAPIPEPGTMMMVALGSVGLIRSVRRRKLAGR